MQDKLEGLGAGRWQTLAVTGDPGIGKSSLLGELTAQALARGFVVLVGQAAEVPRETPFGVWADALDEYLAIAGSTLRSRCAPRRLGLLCRAFPSLRDAIPALDADVSTPPARAEWSGLFGAVRQALTELHAGGLLIVLDDLQLADAGSVALLRYLLRRPVPGPVFLAYSYRPRQLPITLSADLAGSAEEAMELRLGPLTAGEIGQLLGNQVAAAQHSVVHSESGGNPAYAQAMVALRAGRPDGADDPGPSARAALSRLVPELPLMSAAARSLGQAAAILEAEFDAELAAEVAELSGAEAAAALDELVAHDLIRPQAGTSRFAFRHPLARRAVYATTTPGWRRSAHDRANRVLARMGAPVTVRARHVAQIARPGDEQAVTLLNEAADRSVDRDPASAAGLLRAVLRLLPRQRAVDRASTMLRLADATILAGDLRGSRDILHELLGTPHGATEPNRVRAVGLCGAVELLLGHLPQASALLLDAAGTQPRAVLRETIPALLHLASCEVVRGDPALCAEYGRHAFALAETFGDRLGAAGADAVLLLADALSGDIATVERNHAMAAGRVNALLDGELAQCLDTSVSLAWAEMRLDRHDDALAHLDRALSVAHAHGRRHILPHLLLCRAVALRWTGRLDAAAAACAEALHAAHSCGSDLVAGMASAMDIWLGALTGAALPAQTGSNRQKPPRDGWFGSLAGYMAAETRLLGGDPAGCVAMAERVGLPRQSSDPWALVSWAELLTRAELARGGQEAAASWVDRAEREAARLNLPGPQGFACHAGAALLLARRNDRAATEAALSAATWFDKAGMELEAARARLTAARALAASDRPERAEAELIGAKAGLDACGARGLLRQAESERRGPAAIETRIGGLTKREREVAVLVSEGRTNRQVAERLYVTEKTVEMHLSKVFVKLGVSSRAAVAGLVARALN